MSTPSAESPVDGLKSTPRPERIMSALERLCENINDTTASIRSLKRDIVGDPPTALDENEAKQPEMVTPDNFMDRLEQTIAFCEVAHEKALHEIKDFRNKAL